MESDAATNVVDGDSAPTPRTEKNIVARGREPTLYRFPDLERFSSFNTADELEANIIRGDHL